MPQAITFVSIFLACTALLAGASPWPCWDSRYSLSHSASFSSDIPNSPLSRAALPSHHGCNASHSYGTLTLLVRCLSCISRCLRETSKESVWWLAAGFFMSRVPWWDDLEGLAGSDKHIKASSLLDSIASESSSSLYFDATTSSAQPGFAALLECLVSPTPVTLPSAMLISVFLARLTIWTWVPLSSFLLYGFCLAPESVTQATLESSSPSSYPFGLLLGQAVPRTLPEVSVSASNAWMATLSGTPAGFSGVLHAAGRFSSISSLSNSPQGPWLECSCCFSTRSVTLCLTAKLAVVESKACIPLWNGVRSLPQPILLAGSLGTAPAWCNNCLVADACPEEALSWQVCNVHH